MVNEHTTFDETIRERKIKDQEKLLDTLRKMPIIQVACEKAGVSRPTYYRWRKESKKFMRESDAAIADGGAFMDDMVESQLMSLVKDKYWPSIKFYLERRHPKFRVNDDGTPHSPITFNIVKY